MKVLSLLQPWASLVVMGVKTIETRSWTTNYRGPLLIHAGLRKAGNYINNIPIIYTNTFGKLPYGAILGIVQLEKIILLKDFDITSEQINKMSLEDDTFGNHDDKNRYGWVLKEAIQFDEPITTRGSLRLWEFEF